MEQKTWIKILVGIILIMAVAIIYFLVVKPQIDSSATNNQVIGYNIAINSILSQLQQNGYVTMTIGNQTLFLIPYNPKQNLTR